MTEIRDEAVTSAIDVVEDYLSRVGRGDIVGARRHLANGAVITFPGERRYGDLDDLTAEAATRYAWVDKNRDEYHAFRDADGSVMVLSIGRLFGRNLHGVDFADVRYVDVFRLDDGRIVEQRVWNDLGVTGVLAAATPADIEEQWRGHPGAGDA